MVQLPQHGHWCPAYTQQLCHSSTQLNTAQAQDTMIRIGNGLLAPLLLCNTANVQNAVSEPTALIQQWMGSCLLVLPTYFFLQLCNPVTLATARSDRKASFTLSSSTKKAMPASYPHHKSKRADAAYQTVLIAPPPPAGCTPGSG
jgi:hypothetical protein